MLTIAQSSNDSFQLTEAQQRIREMDPLSAEVDRARRQVMSEERSVFELGEDEEEKRERLFGYQPPDLETGDTQALIASSEALLLDAQGMCVESEQIGSETLMAMGRQRNQLENAAGFMDGANEILDKAREILEAMNRKAKRNKRVLYGIIVLLIIANISVIIAIIKKK